MSLKKEEMGFSENLKVPPKEESDLTEFLFIFIEIIGPYKVGDDEWKIEAIATVQTGDKIPVENVRVQFYRDKDLVDEMEVTGSDGRATKEIILKPTDAKREWVIQAQLHASTKKAKKTVRIPEEQKSKKKPDKLLVEAVGSKGKYKIFITVLSEDGKSIKGVKVQIIDSATATMSLHDTNESGVVEFKPDDFGEPWRDYIIRAAHLREVGHLAGSSPETNQSKSKSGSEMVASQPEPLFSNPLLNFIIEESGRAKEDAKRLKEIWRERQKKEEDDV
mgnify:CR=1 FL=1